MKPNIKLSKYIVLAVLAVITVMLFSSCNSAELSGVEISFGIKPASNKDKYRMDKLEEGKYDMTEEDGYVGKLSVYPYNNRLYYVTYNNDVGYYSFEEKSHTIIGKIDAEKFSDEKTITDGGSASFDCDYIAFSNTSITVNESGIFVFLRDTVFLLDFDGNTCKTFSFPDQESYRRLSDIITVSGKYLIAAINYMGNESHNNLYDGRKNATVTEIWAIDMTKKYRQDEESGELLNIEPTGFVYADSLNRIITTEKEDILYLQSMNAVYRYDLSDNSIEVVKALQVGSYDYNISDGNLYSVLYDLWGSTGHNYVTFDKATTDFSKIERVRTLSYNTINRMVLGDEYEEGKGIIYFYRMFYTGEEYLVWSGASMLVIDAYPADDGRTLTVLHRDCSIGRNENTEGRYFGSMDNGADEVDAMMEEKEDVKISRKTYGRDEFLDRIKVKMLAGDDDYDIVLLEDADDILGSVLRYRRYLPLENYTDITDGLDNYISGVKDLMTYDGHIYGVPTVVEAKVMFMQNMTEEDCLIPSDYTLGDYAEIYKENNIVIDRESVINALRSVIEDGVEKGEIDKGAILDVLTIMKECTKRADVSVAENKLAIKISNGVGGGLETFGREEWFEKSWMNKGAVLRALPSYNGKHYMTVKCMAYANSATRNPNIAAKYLACMVSENFRSEKYEYNRSFMAPDPDNYFTYLVTTIEAREKYNPREIGYGWNKVPVKLSEVERFLVENGADLFENSAPFLYSGEISSVIEKAYTQSITMNKMTLEEAAELIYSEAKYRLFE